VKSSFGSAIWEVWAALQIFQPVFGKSAGTSGLSKTEGCLRTNAEILKPDPPCLSFQSQVGVLRRDEVLLGFQTPLRGLTSYSRNVLVLTQALTAVKATDRATGSDSGQPREKRGRYPVAEP
jgi:hypothetical protein